MESPLLLIAAIFGLGAVYVVPLVVLEAFSRYRGSHVLVCPATGRAATVELDALRAAMTSAYGRPKVRVVHCSRWPGHQDCGRGCLKNV